MLIQNLIAGPHSVEFGKHRETVYHFRHLRNDPNNRTLPDPTSPIVANVTDRAHAKALLAQASRYVPFIPEDEDKEAATAEAASLLSEVLREAGSSRSSDGAALPVMDISEDEADAVSIELRMPKEAYQGLQDGTHILEVRARDEDMSATAQPAVMAVTDPKVEELLESGTTAQLRAYLTEHKIKHNLKQPDDVLRTMIREKILLPKESIQQAA